MSWRGSLRTPLAPFSASRARALPVPVSSVNRVVSRAAAALQAARVHTDFESSTRPSALPSVLSVSRSLPDPPQGSSSNREGELSDQEWEIRTGRAIYILQQTLPDFFTTGLISSLDETTPDGKDTSIYSPSVRLEYTPPTPFPPPFPHTLHVEGRPLYIGSSLFVKHTLNALYTDLHVELQRVRVHGQRPPTSLRHGSSSIQDAPLRSQTRSTREKSLFVGLVVRGINRVSAAEDGWEINSTYTFSPTTGFIHIHRIESILPEPHQAFFSALQAALHKIGLRSGSQGAGPSTTQTRSLPSSRI
ncbi:uncharacterized protein BXZ73DRAFT_53607 [Epithele typhae]|uniref:uncharacterized protein n=1 Tax=Epithele typhae TaxID=378194 RepID=UPI002008CB7B|nr:uncharacterized protein BXZ73DRAFT_53607 [Epithele typhae]KAH9916766.1 hypothetical protein BXZ73DRAFT_53607 [Epithele typhae]